ncbi:MAG: ATP-grasp domain-containing protein [Bacteroidetes bacterium]|nr:ATP-grasp domain-containing protein [Bacteroidota bacterium]
MKKALILINQLSEAPTPDEQDVLDQAQVVEEALLKLGFKTERAFFSFNLEKTKQQIIESKADYVFNLVESVDGKAELIHFAPALLQSLKIPFTGSGAETMIITTNKPLAKQFCRFHGILTPDWHIAPSSKDLIHDKKYIAKPIYEDASVGIDDNSVFWGNDVQKLENYRTRYGNNFFVEEFIEGREFNISVFAGKKKPIVLPPAEILFVNFPQDKPTIIGYQAKWKEDSFEYKNTQRTFEFSAKDNALIKKLEAITAQCWEVFNLRGYARVDYRLDKNGNIYVLEANANPCLSADAGFYAAAMKAGFAFEDIIDFVIKDCIK